MDITIAPDGTVSGATASADSSASIGPLLERVARRWRFAGSDREHHLQLRFRFRPTGARPHPNERSQFRPPFDMEVFTGP